MTEMNDDDLLKLEQNAFRESMKDGLTELFGAFVFLFVPLMYRIVAFVAIFVAMYLFFIPYLFEAARQKYTYPRLGYVKLREKESDFDIKPFFGLVIVTFILTGIATFIFTGDIYNFYNWILMLPIAIGLIMFGPSVYLVDRSGSAKYWLFGIFTTMLGFTVVYLISQFPTVNIYDGIMVYSILVAITLVIVGTIKFLRFTRAYPILDLPEDEMSEQ